MGSQRRLYGSPSTSQVRLRPMEEDTSMDVGEGSMIETQEDVDMGVMEQALIPWAPPKDHVAWLASQREQPFGKEEVMESWS